MKRDIGSREAFKICEAEHGLSGEFDKREMAEEIGNIMKKPNDPDSPLYLYVGEDTDDCTDFTPFLQEYRRWKNGDQWIYLHCRYV